MQPIQNKKLKVIIVWVASLAVLPVLWAQTNANPAPNPPTKNPRVPQINPPTVPQPGLSPGGQAVNPPQLAVQSTVPPSVTTPTQGLTPTLLSPTPSIAPTSTPIMTPSPAPSP